MIDWEVYGKIDKWFDEHKEEFISDLIRIVRHPSVSEPGADGYAFGKGCHDCLDDFLKMAGEYGFKTHNFEDHVGTVLYENLPAETDSETGLEADKTDLGDAFLLLDYERMIGIWNHLDVVPVGDGWEYDPFEPTRIGELIVGRGIDDNKAPAVGMLEVFRCLRDIGFSPKWQLAMFEGCDEERGMTDVKYYRENYKCPALSIVADCGFPVCYGEKGMMEGYFVGKEAFSDKIIDLKCGTASNIIPDKAVVKFDISKFNISKLDKGAAGMDELEVLLGCEYDDSCGAGYACDFISYETDGDVLTITAKGISKHSAFPDGSVNAINVLATLLVKLGADFMTESDRQMFEEIRLLTSEYTGKYEDIAFEDEISGATVASGTVLTLRDRKPVLTINIRYAITADRDLMHAKLDAYGDNKLLAWELDHDSAPNHFPKEHPAVSLLTDTFNGIMDENKEPYVIGAGTYARKLPHAFPYGIGGLKKTDEEKALVKKLFKEGHGSYHQPDEHCNMRTVLQGMKIYAYSLYVTDMLEEL